MNSFEKLRGAICSPAVSFYPQRSTGVCLAVARRYLFNKVKRGLEKMCHTNTHRRRAEQIFGEGLDAGDRDGGQVSYAAGVSDASFVYALKYLTSVMTLQKRHSESDSDDGREAQLCCDEDTYTAVLFPLLTSRISLLMLTEGRDQTVYRCYLDMIHQELESRVPACYEQVAADIHTMVRGMPSHHLKNWIPGVSKLLHSRISTPPPHLELATLEAVNIAHLLIANLKVIYADIFSRTDAQCSRQT